MRVLQLALVLLAAVVAGAGSPDGASGTAPAPLTARMGKAEFASEYWDLMARFESGHRLVARFLVTNEGPGEHTAVAVGHVVFPDGSSVDFRNGRGRAGWRRHEAAPASSASASTALRLARSIGRPSTGLSGTLLRARSQNAISSTGTSSSTSSKVGTRHQSSGATRTRRSPGIGLPDQHRRAACELLRQVTVRDL